MSTVNWRDAYDSLAGEHRRLLDAIATPSQSPDIYKHGDLAIRVCNISWVRRCDSECLEIGSYGRPIYLYFKTEGLRDIEYDKISNLMKKGRGE